MYRENWNDRGFNELYKQYRNQQPRNFAYLFLIVCTSVNMQTQPPEIFFSKCLCYKRYIHMETVPYYVVLRYFCYTLQQLRVSINFVCFINTVRMKTCVKEVLHDSYCLCGGALLLSPTRDYLPFCLSFPLGCCKVWSSCKGTSAPLPEGGDCRKFCVVPAHQTHF